jgi:hypothetical protein
MSAPGLRSFAPTHVGSVRRFGIACLMGVVLALSISIGLARSNDYPVGRAVLYATGSSGVSGEAFLRRQLTAGTTEVAVRLSGLSASSAPYWTIETSTGTLVTQSRPAPVTSLGTSMTAETYSVTLPVTSGTSMMLVRIYGSVPGGIVELASGQVYGQPSQTGSEHWW